MTAGPARRRRLRLVIFALLVIILALPTLTGAALMMGITAPRCTVGALPPVPFEDITFPSTEFGRNTPAYFIPGAGVAGQAAPTVIVVPTLSAARGDRMDEALVYHALGMHVLTFDSRACVGGVSPSLGSAEAEQVGDALAYLAGRPDVDTARIGIHGFSAGGAAALMAAAQFPELQAVVAQGNYAQFETNLIQSTQGMGILKPGFDLGARLGYRLMTGRSMAELDVLAAMADVAPRPVLLVYGEFEGAEEPQKLADAGRAAGSDVTVWIVPGAGHGDYLYQDPAAYARQVGGFMAAALDAAGGSVLASPP